MKKDVIITCDYEVFLGKNSGTILNSVIKPTQLILEILKQYSAKAIFFVDATWLLFLKENFPDELNLVSNQLKDIVSQESSVELHLHPQWISAYRKGDSIGFKSPVSYKLHSFTTEEIIDLFRKSIDLLECITGQKVQCFRAGGFCIEPFNQLKQAFEIFNIKYDFSLAPGVYLKSGNSYDFDFSDAPELFYYAFQNDVKTPDNQGEFIEIPLSTYYNNPIYRFSNEIYLRLRKDKISGDGIGIQKEIPLLSRLISKKFGFSKTFLTFDGTSSLMFKYVLRNHLSINPLLVILSHPKTLSGQSLLNLSFITTTCNTMNTKDLSGYFRDRINKRAIQG